MKTLNYRRKRERKGQEPVTKYRNRTKNKEKISQMESVIPNSTRICMNMWGGSGICKS
jgi:hypothetical protein